MPELPEVQTVTDEIQQQWVDKTLVGLETVDKGRLGDLSAKMTLPARIGKISRKGKYILVETTGGNISIHLRMTGKFNLNPPPDDRHVRAVFRFSDGDTTWFVDPRRFGTIEITLPGTWPEGVVALGIDPMSKSFDKKSLTAIFLERKAPVKSILLNQRLIAGLGNIYAMEILFRSNISPLRSGSSLTADEISRLYRATQSVLQEALAKNGTSIRDYRRVDEKTGEYQAMLQVYGKKTCPLGHSLTRVKIAGRWTMYCGICQK